MHLLLTIVMISIAIKYGDRKNLRNYGFTVYYVIICNLLYNILCKDHLLWSYKPDVFLQTRMNVELLYTFVILPGITFVFLSNFPFSTGKVKPILYIIKWVVVSLIIEYVYIKTDRLLLQNGYKYWMEFFFYPVMYGMIYLHHRRPLLSYIFSICIISFLLWYFNISIN
ncbi:CBO0543 family protein [Bacillus pinisoli]|uniref:CBO0543 family protein n=1 Tax=Bacillus pinisoli TaxID=2901866 RepID=UPI001FF5845C|nr:CBO0543 family protein [Bacillus pinisoli]